ncbi:unnamed protein product [Blepharisma stoltei]|uniref:RING-type domain-containing protein n=1 Tax=Blepharisma stoltei TaxID=1481888 RepID=A0AAU9JLE6_9CILI|nr:unnamed protein product [Blepharisma stoltei]
MSDYRYECPLCCENYNIKNNPKILACGHSFCEECLKTVFKSAKKCPLCDGDIAVENITDLPAKTAIIPSKHASRDDTNWFYPQQDFDNYFVSTSSFKNKFSNNSQAISTTLENGYTPWENSLENNGYPSWWNNITDESPWNFSNTNKISSNGITQDYTSTHNIANSKIRELKGYMDELEKSKQNIKQFCTYANSITLESKNQICQKIQFAKKFLQDLEEKSNKDAENYITLNQIVAKKSIGEIDDKINLINRCLGSLSKVLSNSSGISVSLQMELNQLSSMAIPGANIEFYSYKYDPEWTLESEPSFKVGKLDSQQMPSIYRSSSFNSQSSGSVSPIGKYTPKLAKKVTNYEWYTIDNDKGSRRAGPVIEKQIEKGYKKGAKTWRIHHKDHGEYFAIVNYEDRTFKYFSTNKVFKLERVPSY